MDHITPALAFSHQLYLEYNYDLYSTESLKVTTFHSPWTTLAADKSPAIEAEQGILNDLENEKS